MSKPEIKKIVLLGAGATGTIIGALIAKAGYDIDLVSVDTDHVNALNQNGAKITGGMDVTIPVNAVTPDRMNGPYDLVIYSVKSTADDAALSGLLPHLHDNSMVLSTQNGVPEEKIASYVGENRTLGGSIVGWAAGLDAPGVARLAGEPGSMLYKIGEPDGSISDRIQAVKSILEHAGAVEISTNLAGMRWTKLVINVSMSGLSAALGCTFGEILDNPKALDTALSLKAETLSVAEKLGIQVDQVNGIDPQEFKTALVINPDAMRAQLRKFFEPQRSGKPSMLQDLEKGRMTEVESINGFLAKKSKESGIAAPVNDTITEIIRNIQNNKEQLSMKNLDTVDLRPFSDIF